jgi:hypothetical protein
MLTDTRPVLRGCGISEPRGRAISSLSGKQLPGDLYIGAGELGGSSVELSKTQCDGAVILRKALKVR